MSPQAAPRASREVYISTAHPDIVTHTPGGHVTINNITTPSAHAPFNVSHCKRNYYCTLPFCMRLTPIDFHACLPLSMVYI